MKIESSEKLTFHSENNKRNKYQ